jgi:hypothetical protein
MGTSSCKISVGGVRDSQQSARHANTAADALDLASYVFTCGEFNKAKRAFDRTSSPFADIYKLHAPATRSDSRKMNCPGSEAKGMRTSCEATCNDTKNAQRRV